MTIKQRFLYRDAGDHIAFRDASIYIVDNRDKIGLDGRRLYIDEHPQFVGEEPPWVPPVRHLPQSVIQKYPLEVEFDHEPTPEELREAFPNYMLYLEIARIRQEKARSVFVATQEQAEAERQKDLIVARKRLGLA